jgi:hypothetical protein
MGQRNIEDLLRWMRYIDGMALPGRMGLRAELRLLLEVMNREHAQ